MFLKPEENTDDILSTGSNNIDFFIMNMRHNRIHHVLYTELTVSGQSQEREFALTNSGLGFKGVDWKYTALR